MGIHAGQVTKRTIEAKEARETAKAIYLELLKLTGKQPTDVKVAEHLAKQGFKRTPSMIAQWRKADGWAPKRDPLPAVKAFYAEGDGLMPYEAHPSPETVDLLVSGSIGASESGARVPGLGG